MSKGLFVIGTGTDIGKTYVSGLIVKKIQEINGKAAYFKAAMSGNERDEEGNLIPGDALFVKKKSGISQSLHSMCPYVYERALSPHLASRIEGNPVDLEKVMKSYEALKENYDYITVEGSGGILCPICFDERKIFLEDVIEKMQLPTLLVADAGLGTINSVVLTWEYLKQKKIPCKGILFNHFKAGDVCQEDNRRMVEYMTDLKVLGFVKDEEEALEMDEDILLGLYE